MAGEDYSGGAGFMNPLALTDGGGGPPPPPSMANTPWWNRYTPATQNESANVMTTWDDATGHGMHLDTTFTANKPDMIDTTLTGTPRAVSVATSDKMILHELTSGERDELEASQFMIMYFVQWYVVGANGSIGGFSTADLASTHGFYCAIRENVTNEGGLWDNMGSGSHQSFSDQSIPGAYTVSFFRMNRVAERDDYFQNGVKAAWTAAQRSPYMWFGEASWRPDRWQPGTMQTIFSGSNAVTRTSTTFTVEMGSILTELDDATLAILGAELVATYGIV